MLQPFIEVGHPCTAALPRSERALLTRGCELAPPKRGETGAVATLFCVESEGTSCAGAIWKPEQPRLAELGRKKLAGPGVVLVATIRRDGAPRVSPVEPLFWDEDLWLAMGWGTRKAADLIRDPRILVHSVVTDRNGAQGEYKLRGRALPEDDPGVQARFADEAAKRVGWRAEIGKFHLFRVDVEDITFIR